MELTRRNGETSEEDSNFDSYKNTEGKPVQFDVDTDLKTATPVPILGMSFTVSQIKVEEMGENDNDDEMKSGPSGLPETITSKKLNVEPRKSMLGMRKQYHPVEWTAMVIVEIGRKSLGYKEN